MHPPKVLERFVHCIYSILKSTKRDLFAYWQVNLFLLLSFNFSFSSFNFGEIESLPVIWRFWKFFTCPYLGASDFGCPPFFPENFALDMALISEHHFGTKVILFYPSIGDSIDLSVNIQFNPSITICISHWLFYVYVTILQFCISLDFFHFYFQQSFITFDDYVLISWALSCHISYIFLVYPLLDG